MDTVIVIICKREHTYLLIVPEVLKDSEKKSSGTKRPLRKRTLARQRGPEIEVYFSGPENHPV